MTNYWKQFAAWVTKLKDNPFVGPRIKFTLVNFIVFVALAATAFTILGILRTHAIDTHATGADAATISLLNKIQLELFNLSLFIFIGLSAVAGIASYFLSNIAVGPIKHIVKMQKRFVADASHELRTPLSIIKADSELALLDGEEIKPKEAIRTIKSTVEEVDRMSKIIENLLNLSFYDLRAVEIPMAPLDLTALIRNIVNKTRSLAQNKEVELKLSRLPKVTLIGNPTGIEQMVMNLIRNAIVYTPPKGLVTVSLKLIPTNCVEIQIKDTGIGIAEKDLPFITNAFYKAEQSLTKEGSGLGLAIVRKILERHGGSLSISSRLGRGTRVTATLPRVV